MSVMLALFLQGQVTVPAQTVVETSPWTPAMVTALFAGGAVVATAVIGALGKVLIDLRTAKNKAVEAADLAVTAVKKANDVKENVEKARAAGQAAGDARDRKLDALQRQSTEIHKLVDGKFSIVLDRIARLTRTIANQTGNPADIAAAEEAEATAEAQRAKVREAGLMPSDTALDPLREAVAELEKQLPEDE